MSNRPPFAPDEWYHCYSRGVDKRVVFESTADYERFLQLLCVTNSADVFHLSNLQKITTPQVMSFMRGEPLVAIGAYCLMPNHFHLLLKEITVGGISKFMQKLGIAYTMYFNIKNERVGNLLVKPFRSKHIHDDRYFRSVIQYIHLNCAELFEPELKLGKIKNIHSLEKKLREYRYSSYADYLDTDRPEKVILDKLTFELVRGTLPAIEDLISDAADYYAQLAR